MPSQPLLTMLDRERTAAKAREHPSCRAGLPSRSEMGIHRLSSFIVARYHTVARKGSRVMLPGLSQASFQYTIDARLAHGDKRMRTMRRRKLARATPWKLDLGVVRTAAD